MELLLSARHSAQTAAVMMQQHEAQPSGMIITAEWKEASTANFEQHVFIITIVIRPQSHGMETNVVFHFLPCFSPLDPA